MKHTKLVTALESLNKEEWNSLKKYLLMESSKRSDHYRLFNTLWKHKSNFDQLPEKDEFRKTYFPAMGQKSFLNLCSRVYQIFEDWLVWYEMKKDKDRCDVLLLKSFNRRGLFSLADKKYNALNKKLSNQKKLSLAKRRNLYELHHYHHFSENRAKRVLGGRLFEDAVTNFYQSFLEQACLYKLEMKNWGRAIKYDYSDKIEILDKATKTIPPTEESQLLELFHKSWTEQDNSPLLKVLQTLMEKKVESGSDLETFITLYGIEFSHLNWHYGSLTDASQIFRFHEYGLESGVLLKLGKITCLRFVNIINTIVHTLSVEKSYEFIDNWCHLVGDQDVESARNLAYIYPKILENKYEDVILLLRGRKFNNTFTEIRAIAFENMALYKLKEWALLKNRLQNHRRKIRGAKNKMAKYVYDAQISFIKILELLAQSHFKKINPIDLTEHAIVFNKTWLQKEIKSRGLEKSSAF